MVDVSKQCYTGKLTIDNTPIYNYSDVNQFETNEFKTVGGKLYGSIYFKDLNTNEVKKAWVLAEILDGRIVPVNNDVFYQIYRDEIRAKHVDINFIFDNPRNDGIIDEDSPTIPLFNQYTVQVLSGGEYGGAIFRVYPVIDGKVHLGIWYSGNTTAGSGTQTTYTNSVDLPINAGFVKKVATTGALSTTNGSGAVDNGIYYGRNGTNPETQTVSPSMVKFQVVFAGKYSNGSYYQAPYILGRSESGNSNTYYLGQSQGVVRKITFTVMSKGGGTVDTSCIEGLVAIPWAGTQTANRAGTSFKIELIDKGIVIFTDTLKVSTYKGFYIDGLNGVKELV